MPIDARLRKAAQHILVTLTSELTAAGITVPQRKYIHSGQPAHDLESETCADAFIVSWDAAFQGSLGGASAAGGGISPIHCSMPMSVQFTISLLRCVPILDSQGGAPSAASLQSSGEDLLDEAWTLNRIIVDSTLSGSLTQLPIVEAAIGGSLSVGPLGGLGGVAVQLFVGLL